ncbi:uncharacterized protein LOC124277979 [Haliotis rubra]|uniref:uncharacterized protein LOC124277979 n=1 Tax=Haliotis rubra TaxID=36100 RepID=UPI001EE60AB2|nr:uncharacterized protein LOC124277979 [Haliotis rubra]
MANDSSDLTGTGLLFDGETHGLLHVQPLLPVHRDVAGIARRLCVTTESTVPVPSARHPASALTPAARECQVASSPLQTARGIYDCLQDVCPPCGTGRLGLSRLTHSL